MEQCKQIDSRTATVEPPTVEKCKVCNKDYQYIRKEDRDTWISSLTLKAGLSPFVQLSHSECEEKLRRKQEAEARQEVKTRWIQSNRLPSDATTKTFSSFETSPEDLEAVTLMEKFRPSDDFGFLLMGPAGTGKTHLALSLANKILATLPLTLSFEDFFQKVPCYESAASLLQSMRGTDAGNKELRVQSASWLIIDDLGAEHLTDWSREIFFRILDYRFNHRLPTVITTNLTLNELKERMHERTVSRILGLCIPLTIHGKDRRRDLMAGRLKQIMAR